MSCSPGTPRRAGGGVVADQAAQHQGLARAHRHLAGDLALQEAALAGGRVDLAHVGDGLVDLHGDHVAGVDRGRHRQRHAGVLVLDAGGEVAAVGDGFAGRGSAAGCPTAMPAVWLSSTISEGLEMTLTSDLSAKAFSTARTSPTELRKRVGKTGWRRTQHAAGDVARAHWCRSCRCLRRRRKSTAGRMHVVVQRDFDDAGLDQHLRWRHVEPLAGCASIFSYSTTACRRPALRC